MPGRKLTCDTIKVDAVSTDKCHAFHIFAPWMICYDRLPKKGDTWRFVLWNAHTFQHTDGFQ